MPQKLDAAAVKDYLVQLRDNSPSVFAHNFATILLHRVVNGDFDVPEQEADPLVVGVVVNERTVIEKVREGVRANGWEIDMKGQEIFNQTAPSYQTMVAPLLDYLKKKGVSVTERK